MDMLHDPFLQWTLLSTKGRCKYKTSSSYIYCACMRHLNHYDTSVTPLLSPNLYLYIAFCDVTLQQSVIENLLTWKSYREFCIVSWSQILLKPFHRYPHLVSHNYIADPISASIFTSCRHRSAEMTSDCKNGVRNRVGYARLIHTHDVWYLARAIDSDFTRTREVVLAHT